MGSFLFSLRAWRRWWRVIFSLRCIEGIVAVEGIVPPQRRDAGQMTKSEIRMTKECRMPNDEVKFVGGQDSFQRASAEAVASSKSLPSAARAKNLPVESSKTKP